MSWFRRIVDAINGNTDRITGLERLSGTFQYDSQTDHLDIGESPIIIAELDIPALDDGVYILGWSNTYSYDSTTNSVIVDIELNGVTESFRSEPSDITDRVATSYGFPYVHVGGGPLVVKMSMSKSNVAGTLDCHFSNVMLERKL